MEYAHLFETNIARDAFKQMVADGGKYSVSCKAFRPYRELIALAIQGSLKDMKLSEKKTMQSLLNDMQCYISDVDQEQYQELYTPKTAVPNRFTVKLIEPSGRLLVVEKLGSMNVAIGTVANKSDADTLLNMQQVLSDEERKFAKNMGYGCIV